MARSNFLSFCSQCTFKAFSDWRQHYRPIHFFGSSHEHIVWTFNFTGSKFSLRKSIWCQKQHHLIAQSRPQGQSLQIHHRIKKVVFYNGSDYHASPILFCYRLQHSLWEGGIRGYFRTESVVWQNQEEVAFSEEIPIHDMHYCLTW